jgi:hypothetical protein
MGILALRPRLTGKIDAESVQGGSEEIKKLTDLTPLDAGEGGMDESAVVEVANEYRSWTCLISCATNEVQA